VFLGLRDIVSMFTDRWMLVYGVLFMAIILFLPEGVLGLVKRVRRPAGFHDPTVAREDESVAAGPAAGVDVRTR